MKQAHLSYKFVEYIPEQLDEEVLYISQRYRTAAHKCCCGCGQEVITPLTLTDWSLKVEGGLVSLYPSMGNWSYTCRSHYWINKGKVIWAGEMTELEIQRGRVFDQIKKEDYFKEINRDKSIFNKSATGWSFVSGMTSLMALPMS